MSADAVAVESVPIVPVPVHTPQSLMSFASIEDMQSALAPYHVEVRPCEHEDMPSGEYYVIKFTEKTPHNCYPISQIKGTIFHQPTMTVLSMTYPVPLEVKDLLSQDIFPLLSNLSNPLVNAKITSLVDGTMIRFTYAECANKWIVSTHHKMDAKHAYWINNVSFKDMLDDCEPKIDTSKFDTNHIYFFIMCHPKNTIVVAHETAKVVHMATIDRSTQAEIEVDIGIPKPVILDNLTPIEAFTLTQQQSNFNLGQVNDAGYMIEVKDDKGVCWRYRLEFNNYSHAKMMRGNSVNLDYICLQRAMKDELPMFVAYFPQFKDIASTTYARLEKFISTCYNMYNLKFKLKDTDTFVNPKIYKFLTVFHKTVYVDALRPQNRKVGYNDMSMFIKGSDVPLIAHLMN